MNKYRAESRAAQAKLRRERMCSRKVRFSDLAEAVQRGQRVYACGYCGGWHRSGSLQRLMAKVRQRREESK